MKNLKINSISTEQRNQMRVELLKEFLYFLRNNDEEQLSFDQIYSISFLLVNLFDGIDNDFRSLFKQIIANTTLVVKCSYNIETVKISLDDLKIKYDLNQLKKLEIAREEFKSFDHIDSENLKFLEEYNETISQLNELIINKDVDKIKNSRHFF